jgi:predicted aspartyl protease
MAHDMGTFRIDVSVENPARPGERHAFNSVLVDTGAELSVFPASALESLHIERLRERRFRQADGTILSRWSGSARIYAAGTLATDDVVFGEPTDLTLLGARSLEGLNLRIDPVSRRLVDAGPMPLAVVLDHDVRSLAMQMESSIAIGSSAKSSEDAVTCANP